MNDISIWNDFLVKLDNMPLALPGCYRFTCIVNNKPYVGISRNIYGRCKHHDGAGRKFQNALKKYGKNLFICEPLFYLLDNVVTDDDRKMLSQLEADYIKDHNSVRVGYNIQEASGAVGPYGEEFALLLRGVPKSLEARKNMSLTRAGIPKGPISDVRREGIRAGNSAWWAKNKCFTITNGIKNTRILTTAPIPEGWYRGRTAINPRKPLIKKDCWIITDGIKNKQILANSIIPQGWRRGITGKQNQGHRSSPETNAKLSKLNRGRIWITNGVNNRVIFPDSPIPEGWYRGQSWRNQQGIEL